MRPKSIQASSWCFAQFTSKYSHHTQHRTEVSNVAASLMEVCARQTQTGAGKERDFMELGALFHTDFINGSQS